jgi:L-aminopeptidase/D-esterase-like protein
MLAQLGIRVGHWTDAKARTGCTVALLPTGTTGSAEVRGGAPASRELEVLSPQRTVERVDAVVLTGGSSFGLAAADGVMRYCEERDLGVATPGGPVPIVPALALFDLAVGDPQVRPGPSQGYAACLAAETEVPGWGPVGAGAGATVASVLGADAVRAGGIALAEARIGELIVAAVVAVNAFGAIDSDGTAADRVSALATPTRLGDPSLWSNTTLGLVASNARLGKLDCLVVAQGAHDGLARAVVPSHTRWDGDAFIAVATGEVPAGVDVVRHLTTTAVERAIRSLG